MSNNEPTKKQMRILRLLARGIAKTGTQPSVRELMKQLKAKSPNGVQCHIKALEKKGYLERSNGMSRAIKFNWKEYV